MTLLDTVARRWSLPRRKTTAPIRRFRPELESLDGRIVPAVIVPPSELGSLSGIVYVDCDQNGTLDDGEERLEGVTVTLTGNTGLTRIATTDAAGNYRFLDLPAGTYTITETQPAGFGQGTNAFGNLGGVVDGDAITGIVVAGRAGTGYNFGEIVTPSTLSLTLTKTADKATYAPGETITYTYVVTNGSPLPLTNVTVRDDNATPGVTSDDFTVGTVATLAPGASVTFTATRIAPTPPPGSTGSGVSYPLPTGPSTATIDLTTAGASAPAATGFVFQTDTQPTGTGFIRSFVRFQGAAKGGGSEQGVNTDARPVPFDEKKDATFTHALPVGQVPTVSVNGVAYREFLLDINQKGSSPKLSVDDIRIFLGGSGALTPTAAEAASGVKTLAGLAPVYDLDAGGVDRTILLNARLTNGSGSGDMFLLVPESAFAGAGPQTFVYLYSKMGGLNGATANAGFEEWAVRKLPAGTPTPPGPLTLTNIATGTGTACGVPATATASATVTVVPPTTPTPTPTPTPPSDLKHGDTATIGFWQNKNGQALISSLNGGPTSKALATWLATNLPNLFGANAGANNLTGKTNTDVAATFVRLFNVQGMKTDAQILGAALAVYATDSDLSGNAGAKYGFNVSTSGTGAKTYNVGSNGSEVGLADNTSYTVFQLLKQADAQKGLNAFDKNAFNSIFDAINNLGDRL